MEEVFQGPCVDENTTTYREKAKRHARTHVVWTWLQSDAAQPLLPQPGKFLQRNRSQTTESHHPFIIFQKQGPQKAVIYVGNTY